MAHAVSFSEELKAPFVMIAPRSHPPADLVFDLAASSDSLSIQFLILATDGVWDVTEIGQAVQIVQVRQARKTANLGRRDTIRLWYVADSILGGTRTERRLE